MTAKQEMIKAVNELVNEKGLTTIEAISLMQSIASKTKNMRLLDMLCEYKWEVING
tara:strand:+ start:414 stop:581 length:168 start_codon:yes stop_codon:yes gene_type:complete